MSLAFLPVSSLSKQSLRCVFVCAFALGLCAPVSAQTPPNERTGLQPESPASEWGIGIGAISQQLGIKDIDRNTNVFPFISYENRYIRWFGPNLDVKLPSLQINNAQRIAFTLSVGYDFSGYDDDDIKDTPVLQGMDERDGGFVIGATAQWETPVVNVSAKWTGDISGDRDGSTFSLGLDKRWMLGQQVMLSPRIVATWLDESYVDYQYGVLANEATADRQAYSGDSTINIELGLRTAYLFNRQSSIFIDASIISLGDEIKDSPLVDSSTENRVMFAYLYKF